MTDRLPIATVVVGERRREDMGDIGALAASIARYGLLHPIVVDDDGNLVAGGRRLDACKQLQWDEIPITLLGDLTEAERREIELEENLRRKDLTQYERDKILVGLAATATEVLKQQDAGFLTESVKNPQGGRPKKADAGERVAERIGIPRTTLLDAERHVETVDTYIPSAGPDWKQYHVLEARTHLDEIPEPQRPAAAKLIDQPGIPPRDAVAVLRNLAAMPDERRGEVLTLSESDDVRERSRAFTTAAAVPPMPDPRLTRFDSAITELRGAVAPFPDDPITPRIRTVIAELRAIRSEIKQGGQVGN